MQIDVDFGSETFHVDGREKVQLDDIDVFVDGFRGPCGVNDDVVAMLSRSAVISCCP